MYIDENSARRKTMPLVVPVKTIQEQVAWDAVWHFFIGGGADFERLYERGIVTTRSKQDKIYLNCSVWLFDCETYIAELLDTGNNEKLLDEIIIPLSASIAELI